jgi:hypothetical protein
MKTRALLFAVTLLFAAASGADKPFTKGQAVTLKPDSGYVLVRTTGQAGGMLRGTFQFSPLLIRVLTPEELDAAKAVADANPDDWKEKVAPNVVEPLADRPYAEAGDEMTLLMPLKPGIYVLGGMAATNWAMKSEGVITSSLCMGTVKFEVKPGVIVDLGTIVSARDDLQTDIPELKSIVVGKMMGFSTLVYDVALRPGVGAVPEKLKDLPIVPADYSAVPPYPNYFGGPVNRIAPVPGVIDYDANGNVIDLRAPPPPTSPAPSAQP